jgi:hypothetical protein
MDFGYDNQDYNYHPVDDELEEQLQSLVYLIAIFAISVPTGIGITEKVWKSYPAVFSVILVFFHLLFPFLMAVMKGAWVGIEWLINCLVADLLWGLIFRRTSLYLDPVSILPVLILVISFISLNRLIVILPKIEIPERYFVWIYLGESVLIYLAFNSLVTWRCS